MAYKRLAIASALVPLAFALLGLAAWATGLLRLASLDPDFIPMAPATAAAFVLVGAAAISSAFGRGTATRIAVRAAAGIVITFAFLALLEFLGYSGASDWQASFAGQSGTFDGVPLARMSPLTATTFAMAGLALGCLTSGRWALRDAGGVAGGLVLLMGSTVGLGYAYGAPLLYGGAIIPMALTTGIGFVGTGLALVALAGPASLPLRPFSRSALRAHLAETERQREGERAEEEIRRHARLAAEAEREFRAMFAGNPLAMWIYDLATLRFLEVNDAAVRRYGYDRAEFLDMTLEDIRPAEDVQRLAGHLGQPRETWQASGDWRHRLKSGQIIDVDITSHATTFAGRPAALVVAQDVTELKRSVEALRAAEERTQFALDSADVGIWDMDYVSGALKWSETLEAQYGLQPGTFAGTFDAFVNRIHPDDRARVLETLGTASKTGLDFSILSRTTWPDGTVHWLSGAGRILLDAHGEPVRGLGISQDVTERKRSEAALAHLNEEIQLQRLRVFKATMRTVHDIVNNLLNGLQLAQGRGEGQQSVEMQRMVDRMIQDAAAKLRSLGNLETIKETEMAAGPGIDYPGANP